MTLPEGWKLVKARTDCTSCHYTIEADDPEGMFFVGGKPYCSENCYYELHQELEVPGVDSVLPSDTIRIKKER